MNLTKPIFLRVAFRALLILAVAVIFNGTAQAQRGGNGGGGGGGDDGPSYQIIPLDISDGAGGRFAEGCGAHDINLSRLIVGSVDFSAAYWTVTESDGTFQSAFHFLDDSAFSYSTAWGCNEWGEVVGDGGSGGEATALYWSDTSADVHELPAPFTFVSSARGINNEGVICGTSIEGYEATFEKKAVVWSRVNGQWDYLELTPLGDPGVDEEGEPLADAAYTYAISDKDTDTGLITIAGQSNGNAVIWTVFFGESGSLIAGPSMILDPGIAHGVNNRGTVCGNTPPGSHGVIWQDGGTAESLAFDDPKAKWDRPQPGLPRDVNDNGLLVGTNGRQQAVMWSNKDAPLIALQDFLPKRNSLFTHLVIAGAVNEANEIVGGGTPDGGATGLPFLAIPK